MKIILGIIAGIIFLAYSIYFYKIIIGKPGDFEISLLQALESWIMEKGSTAQSQMWFLLVASAAVEIIYFTITLILLTHPLMRFLTAFLVGEELYHLVIVGIRFKQFFQQQIEISSVFNWLIERLSAVMYFTHSFLVLTSLVIFRC